MGFLDNDGLLYYDEKMKTHIDNTTVKKVEGKGLSTEDYTTSEKNKLSGIASGANKTIIDSYLSSSSTNPVQNKVVTEEISNIKTSLNGMSFSISKNNCLVITYDDGLN